MSDLYAGLSATVKAGAPIAKVRYKDMGDGTYAEVVSVEGGGGGGEIPNPLPVTGPITDDELRASALAVSGPLTDTQLRAAAVPVSGPLTNAQLTAVTGTATQTAVTTDPEASGQTIAALLRGILAEMQAQTALLAAIADNTTPAE